MHVTLASSLLGGLSPAQFMRRHWQKKPLLVRQAWPGVRPPLTRSALFALAQQPDVESRLVVAQGDGDWRVRQGPLPRHALPPLARPGWTLLLQGLDLHVEAARAMLAPFRFVPEARLDDLMLSWASDGGGVGPHVDAYDVFLLQVAGRRRWRVGRVADASFVDGLPLKILRHFEPEFDCLLEPGDMLYLPPLWGHDGRAEGECMTCSVGFRAPRANELACDLLQRLADDDGEDDPGRLYRDAAQAATATPGLISPALQDFARQAIVRRLADVSAIDRALGESLSEPKPHVWFEAAEGKTLAHGVQLDRRSRMLYDSRHVFFNGEAYVVAGRDARLVRLLADARQLDAHACAALSAGASDVLQGWLDAGWLHPAEEIA
ncbi:MAG: cupin domain-containing protein [Rubrivivax sp.]|nr:cupin domain-containing protein [Rubrivivax sp.]MBK8527088.1 cupin domain-containing protein [Rubrivivax sp.]